MSGGVIIADKINATTTKCFLYFFNSDGVNIPTLLKKYTIKGNSKTTPAANTTPVTVDTYVDNVGNVCTSLLIE